MKGRGLHVTTHVLSYMFYQLDQLDSAAMTAPEEEVVQQNDDRYDQQNVDEGSGDMENEAKQPQYKENHNNCPQDVCKRTKHVSQLLFFSSSILKNG